MFYGFCSYSDLSKGSVAKEPYGYFKLKGNEDYQIIVNKDNVYYLCSSKYCTSGNYVSVNNKKNIIKLMGFYKKTQGLEIEKLAVSHGYYEGNYELAVEHRVSEPSPDDLVFYVHSSCGEEYFFLGNYHPDGAVFVRDEKAPVFTPYNLQEDQG